MRDDTKDAMIYIESKGSWKKSAGGPLDCTLSGSRRSGAKEVQHHSRANGVIFLACRCHKDLRHTNYLLASTSRQSVAAATLSIGRREQ